MNPKLELRQRQQLTMTPQLRQAIGMLQMGSAELTALLEEEVGKNPLLAFAEPDRRPAPAIVGAHDGLSDGLDNIASEASLRERLRGQILMSEKDAALAKIACALVDELDEHGFLRVSYAELQARLKVEPPVLEQAVHILQACEPTGIGARDLRECLALQIIEAGRMDPVVEALLDNLDLLAHGNYPSLARRMKVSLAQLEAAVAVLHSTNPRPAEGFDAMPVQMAIPEILVERDDGGEWQISLNPEAIPRVLLDETYDLALGSAAEREYIAENRARASFVVRALDRRARTMLQVAQAVVRRQFRFFESGLDGLRPLTLADIAKETGLHEATVSRVTRGKYLESPRGNLEMRFFFTRAANKHGGEETTTTVVKERIRKLIASETGNTVLSDERIRKILQDEGVDIARRTVAKYREGMGIPSSSRRRRIRT